ncbi:MAG: hypothetical protein ACRDIF_00040 [Actinomycetota bacterium]
MSSVARPTGGARVAGVAGGLGRANRIVPHQQGRLGPHPAWSQPPVERRRRWAPLMAAAMASIALVGLLLLNVGLAQGSFRLAALEDRVAREEARRRQLVFELASADSPARLARSAEVLGLLVPSRQEVVEPAGRGGSLAARGRRTRASGSSSAPAALPRPSRR